MALLGGLAALSACNIPPVRNQPYVPPASSATYAPAVPTGPIVVQPGDTLYGLAQRNGVTMSDLARVNGISDPFNIYVGQSLVLPPAPMGQMAQQPGVSATPYGSTAYTPQPIAGASSPTPTGALPPRSASSVERVRLDAPPPQAASTGQPAPTTAPPQPAAAPFAVASASPATVPEPVPRPSSPPPAETAAPEPSSQQLVIGGQMPASTASPTASSPAPSPVAEPAPQQLSPEQQAAAAVPPARASSKFAWPVEGRTVASFGTKPDGTRNNGINIAAERGTPVHAADNGIVAYAGNELRGYGNLVLLRHADGWVTTYAHLDTMSVRRGQTVAAGAVIGTVGSTGSAGEPQLHFEVRRNNEVFDPRDYLASGGSSS